MRITASSRRWCRTFSDIGMLANATRNVRVLETRTNTRIPHLGHVHQLFVADSMIHTQVQPFDFQHVADSTQRHHIGLFLVRYW